MAICHTVQVAGIYEEDEDRAEEDEERQQSLLNYSGEVPPIFHKSLEELNEIESVHEEIDFIASRQTVTFENRNGSPKPDEIRPFSYSVSAKQSEVHTHKRPMSLSNIQIPKHSVPGEDSPKLLDNLLLKRVKQQDFKRTVSHSADVVSDKVDGKTHRRTRSSIPFGSKKKFHFN